ncbi:MAG TPA: EAL domain-containing protein [Allosphingosinicella sp.]|nr:EAL domain-containing protein [Allosphingosinicella sp.]
MHRMAVRQTNRTIVLPVILLIAAASLAIAILLSWSGARTDSISLARQEQMLSSSVDTMALDLATSLEGHAIWDDAVLQTHRKPLDMAWLESVYGQYMFSTRGRGESYLLDSAGQPYFAARAGTRVGLDSYAERRALVAPEVARLRRMMLHPAANIAYRKWKIPTIVDIVDVHGKPAVLILQPIVSETGKIVQKPGTEHVWVFFYWLDAGNLQKIASQFDLGAVRFSWTTDHGRKEAVRPIYSSQSAKPAGYFVWRPFTPGTIVLRDMIAPLIAALALVASIVFLLIRRIRRSTAELVASEEQAKHLAFHDTLTGLPNRALFDDRLERALAAARRAPQHGGALLFLDVDRFKQVNDTLGHAAGDDLIREVARRLSRVVRESDTVARLGGDEFAIIQTEVRSKREIDQLCRRILKAIDAPFDVLASQIFVGMSIGVARIGRDGYDRHELARKADIALYQAKQGGRGCYRVFARAMDASVRMRQAIEQDLRTALEKGEQLEVYYQPKYDVRTRQISGVEALVRWHHPTQGLLCPALFIPIAEESGLIEALGEWVLSEACKAALPWPLDTIAVNISAVQLRNPLFANRVIRILHDTGLDPGRLDLEITETSFLENVEQCRANLKMLRLAGIRISLDDFGTGYSSFSHLREYEVDRLKIDRSFTNAIDDSPDGSAIIRAIISLAQSSGLKVTAEGVETAEQSHFLSDVGCDELQGFLMSGPVSLRELDRLLGIDPAIRSPAGRRLAA